VLALPAGERLTLRSGQQIAAFWMSPRPVPGYGFLATTA